MHSGDFGGNDKGGRLSIARKETSNYVRSTTSSSARGLGVDPGNVPCGDVDLESEAEPRKVRQAG